MSKRKLCMYSGCMNISLEDKHYCSKHIAYETKYYQRKVFTYRAKSKPYHDLYYTPFWRKTRKEFLQKNPYCVICGAKADTVDHIRPHRGNADLFYDVNNLQALCHSCHSAKTFRENNNFHVQKDRRIVCLTNGMIYQSAIDASNRLGIPDRGIYKVLKGERDSTHGYKFVYLER